MADYSPTWESIVSKWIDALKVSQGIGAVYSPYPLNAVDALELPCVVINEPTNMRFSPLTFKAMTVTYTGDISLLVKAIDTGQARAMSGDINAITAAALVLNLAVHKNRGLSGFVSQIVLGEGRIARLSPYDDDNRGNYIGLSVPYTITANYGSDA